MKPWFLAFFLVLPGCPLSAAEVNLELPKAGLIPEELAVVVNDNDPDSASIAEYYRQRRGIPRENMLHVRFAANAPNLPANQFNSIRASVMEQSSPHIQAYALAWTLPYRVDCMSITSAFAFGFDESYCSKKCGPTKPSPYFDSPSVKPYADYGIRPSMLLAGKTVSAVKRLIDRGVESDHTYPHGTGYLLNTSDIHRTVRAVYFEKTINLLGEALHLERWDADSIKDKQDVLFYFTGVQRVENLPSLHFLPGAIADHLTSAGGELDGKGQMSSLNWLEAGATGSYGTVVEPCNHLQKFPMPSIVIGHYAQGETLLEAYWKSVAWPGEGVFIGEPLAHPYDPSLTDISPHQGTLRIFSPLTKVARLIGSESPIGPYQLIAEYAVQPGMNQIPLHLPEKDHYYRIVY